MYEFYESRNCDSGMSAGWAVGRKFADGNIDEICDGATREAAELICGLLNNHLLLVKYLDGRGAKCA